MVQPKKLRKYICPLHKCSLKAGTLSGEQPAIEGRYCLNSCSEYKHNKCPRFPHTW